MSSWLYSPKSKQPMGEDYRNYTIKAENRQTQLPVTMTVDARNQEEAARLAQKEYDNQLINVDVQVNNE
jgi:hypothetical protein